MMFPSGTAAAGPGGPPTTGEALPGAPEGAPGGASVQGDDPGFTTFDVALLAVLERATLSDVGGQVLPDCTEQEGTSQLPSGTDGALPAIWLQSIGAGPHAAGAAEDSEPDAVPGKGDAEGSETDEEAAVVAALVLAASPIVEKIPVPSGGAALPGEGTGTGSMDRPVADPTTASRPGMDRPAGDPTTASRPGDGDPPGAKVALPVGEAASETEAEPKSPTAHEKTVDERSGNRSHAAAHPATRAARAFELRTPPHETPAAVAPALAKHPATTDQTEVAAAASATPPASPTEGESTHGSPFDVRAENVQNAQGQPLDSSTGDRSRQRSHDERAMSPEATWLRRSSSIEARLSPPVSFALPLAAPGAFAAAAGVIANATQTPPFTMPAPAENLSRLVQSIRVQARDGVSQASVRLNPEHLGEVAIAIRVDNGIVTAVVRAEAGDVRQWLRGQEDSIRAALAEQGLTLDEFVVEQDGRRGRDQEQQGEEQPRRNRARGQRVNAPSFEVTA